MIIAFIQRMRKQELNFFWMILEQNIPIYQCTQPTDTND